MPGRPSFPRAAIIAAAALIAVVLGCRSRREPPPAASPAPVPAQAAVDQAVGSVGTPAGRFIGSEACRPCHEAEWAAWSGSRHRLTLRPVDASTIPKIASVPPQDGYSVSADGAVEGPGVDGAKLRGRAAYLVGGRHREDLWVRLEDGRLQVFPRSWDVDANGAFSPLQVLSGGSAPPPDSLHFWTRLGRSADLVCYGCHATGAVVTVSGATPAGNAVPRSRWVEPGVGCEGCHGPGSVHAALAQAGKPSAGAIRVGKGTAGETAVATCGACHSLRELLASPFRDHPAQGYGDPIWPQADPVLRPAANFEFREAFFNDLRPATYQQEAAALGQSACVRRGALTCAACHDAHSGGPTVAVSGASAGDDACRPCHEELMRNAAAHARHPAGSPGARCLACHMPPILRGPGKAPARDHSLTPPWAPPGEVPAACSVCHASADWAARLPTAWRAFRQSSAAVGRRKDTAAVIVAASSASHGVGARLARLLDDPESGWFIRWAAASRLGDANAPRDGGAVAALRRAIRDPNAAVRRASISALGNLGAPADTPALEDALDDSDPFVALDAAIALGRLHDPLSGSRLSRVTQRPDLIGEFRAQLALGQAALQASNWAFAEQALRRALELNPAALHAWNDLGVALSGQQRVDDARKVWTQILETFPGYTAARRNLESAGAPSDAGRR